MMTKQNIDQALDAILRAAGSQLAHYTMPASLDRMREVMRISRIPNDLHIERYIWKRLNTK